MPSATYEELLFRQLRRFRKVQRRIELLKPELDSAIDELQKLAVATRAVERSPGKKRKDKQ